MRVKGDIQNILDNLGYNLMFGYPEKKLNILSNYLSTQGKAHYFNRIYSSK